MSLRKSLVRFVVVTAPFVFFSVATQTPAQSQDENANATAPLYKTASIKLSKSNIHAGGTTKSGPDELTATNEPPQALIEDAYDVQDDQIVGAPNWLNSKRYDIEAKADNPAAGEGGPGGERILQALLSDRFKLAVHRETRLIPVYELVIAGDGPKLRESDSNHDDYALRVIQVESGRIMGREVPIATLARILSDELGRPVLDNTKLSSHYDVTLQWPTDPDASQPAILTAIQEQLGLKLVPQLMPKEFLVIDHVEMPEAE
jgi:uncharacterized protein (TIGR03435 family)